MIPASAASESAETLTACGLVVAKKGLSIDIDHVRAVVLQCGPDAGERNEAKLRDALPRKTI